MDIALEVRAGHRIVERKTFIQVYYVVHLQQWEWLRMLLE